MEMGNIKEPLFYNHNPLKGPANKAQNIASISRHIGCRIFNLATFLQDDSALA